MARRESFLANSIIHSGSSSSPKAHESWYTPPCQGLHTGCLVQGLLEGLALVIAKPSESATDQTKRFALGDGLADDAVCVLVELTVPAAESEIGVDRD